MYLVREVVHCKPGKVRPMVEKFKGISDFLEERGQARFRLLTDLSGEPFWSVIIEATVERVDDFFAMEEEVMANEAIRTLMADYHELVQGGRREIYRIED